MSKELYIVKTNANPNLFDPHFVCGAPSKFYADQSAFIEKVKEQHPEMAFPFYAILSQERSGLMEFLGVIGREPLPADAQSICGRIDELTEGHNPMRTIVDFTNSNPQLLKAYELLKQNYDVKEVEIKDIA